MQAEAEVALIAQMAQRGWVEPDHAAAQRVLMADGTILSIEEARKTGLPIGLPAVAAAAQQRSPSIPLTRPPLMRPPAPIAPVSAAARGRGGGGAVVVPGEKVARSEAEEVAAAALSHIVHAAALAVGLGDEMRASDDDICKYPPPHSLQHSI
jgi:hypothetical protein